MYVYTVELCCNDEYGHMETVGIFSSAEEADEWAQSKGWQNEIHCISTWFYRTDYYNIKEWEVDAY